MRKFLPFTTSHLRTARGLAAVVLAAAALGACGVDQSGLGGMPFLPHDASSADTAGSAGATGNPGSAGSSVLGTAGMGGSGGSGGSTISGTGGDGAGGNVGTAGATGTAGNAGTAGNVGTAGDTGTAGSGGTAGNAGTAGNSGTAGTSGAAGNPGTAGDIGTGGSVGTAGSGGSAGVVGTAGRGGSGGGGRGGTGGGGRGGTGGNGRGGTGGFTTPCTPTTCTNGCCRDSTTCVRMRTAAECGSNGAMCAPCGGCQVCSGTGQCQIDNASRWTIVAVSAQLKTSNWDRPSGEIGGSLPDPFCEYENPAGQVSTTTAGVTDTLIDTLNPTWNQVISPAGMTVSAATLMSNNPTWQIWVGDDDGCASPSCLADVACTIRQPVTETQLRAGQMVVTGHQNCNSVTIGFTCQSN